MWEGACSEYSTVGAAPARQLKNRRKPDAPAPTSTGPPAKILAPPVQPAPAFSQEPRGTAATHQAALSGAPQVSNRQRRPRQQPQPSSALVTSSTGEKSPMTKYKLEYIWLDGYTPVPNLRGKTQIKDFESFPTLDQLPLWGFDGSSTMQAEGHSSDCVLKPVAVYPDGARTNGVLVMCEVMMPDGKTPHPTNKRATILDDPGAWFGFEQEYFFYKDGRPLGFPDERLSCAAGPLLHRRRLQERRRRRPQDRRGASRPLPRRRHQPRRHQRRSGEGPVGIPDLRQGLQEGRRRDVDGPLPDAAAHREIRHRYRIPLQAARRHRLERLGHARQLLDRVHARRSAARNTSRR